MNTEKEAGIDSALTDGRKLKAGSLGILIIAAGVIAPCTRAAVPETASAAHSIGRHEIATVPFDPDLILRSATFTPSGKILVSYARNESEDRRFINLAITDEGGANLRTFFSRKIPERPKDNGIRFMVFGDNKRIFLGDFIIECATSLETCQNPTLLPVEYPAEVASGDHVAHRWSEMIVAPDGRHIAWTTLLANFAALVFTGELEKEGGTYKIASPQIVSTLDPFEPDPAHPGGVLPRPVRGGEVKQFVHGGTAISAVGGIYRDIPDSVVQDLATGRMEAITDTPGYTETTIFSPDERLGIVMTTRFSEKTDPAILGLLPRPFPDSLNMRLSMLAYTYSVTGVRRARSGNIGPALIEIEASKTQKNYRGINLNTDPEWVYRSPMSWHPDGKKAMWQEARRDGGSERVQIVTLPDYRPAARVVAKSTPDRIPYATSDLSAVVDYARASQNVDVKVYGRKSGHIEFRRTPDGVIEKKYVDYSDDAQHVYSGRERMEANPLGRSTYTAKIRLVGPKPGTMDLRMTFGPLNGELPGRLIFDHDENGAPLTYGYAEYDGRRLNADALVP